MKNEYIAIGLGVLAILIASVSFIQSDSLAGTTNFDTIDVSDGYQVDGTTIIDGTGSISATSATFSGNVVFDITTTPLTSTTTILASQSGSTFVISASGTTYTLPAVTNDGFTARFVVGGAFDTANAVIASAEGDNINGTLIVAGAVVDCRGEDFINSIADGEQVGDFVEVYSDGTQWLIGDSGVLTSAKMTCTDPS